MTIIENLQSADNIKFNTVNLPPRVSVVKHNTVIDQTTIRVFLVQCLKYINSSLALIFLQLLILNQITT